MLDVYCHLWSEDPTEIADVKDTLNPKKMISESHKYDLEFSSMEEEIRSTLEKGNGIDNIKKMASMHFSRNAAFNLIDEEYDTIVYSRYDVQIHQSFKFDNVHGILTPTAESWGVISDIFAILHIEYAKHYFLYDYMQNLLSTQFESEFTKYLGTIYPAETIRIHNDERYCPHMLLLRNLFLNKVPIEKFDLPLSLQR